MAQVTRGNDERLVQNVHPTLEGKVLEEVENLNEDVEDIDEEEVFLQGGDVFELCLVLVGRKFDGVAEDVDQVLAADDNVGHHQRDVCHVEIVPDRSEVALWSLLFHGDDEVGHLVRNDPGHHVHKEELKRHAELVLECLVGFHSGGLDGRMIASPKYTALAERKVQNNKGEDIKFAVVGRKFDLNVSCVLVQPMSFLGVDKRILNVIPRAGH
mmetsp:Transcript_116950/g.174664  ORF Transcript_116950/g.174664 Transcript_116950/m.174664 type:complete len:213 (-) Transcript_116950:383-1021(-)